uniref:Cyclin-dependent kinase 2 homolog n=1 Tax=Octactis speculum TaxID=3111310 RepID=A0A7S2GAC5_9STRA|mmetsp:Transcript_41451/g.56498  ORF Transcript_41451/g.56498 Transcript_41451/m.56498 type:complete len:335 (+) Transcript_41451:47-1051(+)
MQTNGFSAEPARQRTPYARQQYQLGARLGEGTWGEVFLGTGSHDGARVAIKRIKQKPSAKFEGINFSALREIRLMREIRHKNVVELIDVFTRGSLLHLVLELLDTDLEDVLYKRKVELSPSDIKSYVQMMLQGLEFCHSHCILHRDLKPGNVFVSAQGIVKLADFGLSRCHGGQQTLYMTPEVITQWYRPPELIFGACEYGGAVDMWSIGCLIAELWLKQPIFAGLPEGSDKGGTTVTQQVSDIDQLGKIFMILGTPNETTWPGVTLFNRYVEFQETSPIQWEAVLSNADESGVQLVEETLQLDPHRRLTATQALKHTYFTVPPKPTPPSDLPR